MVEENSFVPTMNKSVDTFLGSILITRVHDYQDTSQNAFRFLGMSLLELPLSEAIDDTVKFL